MTDQIVKSLEMEIAQLRVTLKQKELELERIKRLQMTEGDQSSPSLSSLSKDDIERYSRQIIIPDVGVKGQLALKKSSVLIVGMGGLGCPASLYLAGAGVGHLGLVDYDRVEISNLHRQLLHSEETVNQAKVTSAKNALKRLNSSLRVTEFPVQLDSSNALDIVRDFDVILDATDNVATRYLLNDACVLSNRPLVSGSALRLEGQLTVYNYNSGPCYRCLFPKPPPPESVTSCGDGGVLGVVPGVIGVLQALEAIQVILSSKDVLAGHLLLFNTEKCTFRRMQLRGRNPICEVCGEKPSVTHLIDYEQFCGSKANDKDSGVQLLKKEQRISAAELQDAMCMNQSLVVIDVRDVEEFEMCALPDSINVPLKNLSNEECLQDLRLCIKRVRSAEEKVSLCVVCRRGNDSQIAVLKLQQLFQDSSVTIRDLEGGLHSWARTVDSNFPIY